MDISDIRKRYARKMEHVARVKDGSEKKLAHGYWTLSVLRAEVGRSSRIPLYGSLYSQKNPDFQSKNLEIRRPVNKVSDSTDKREG